MGATFNIRRMSQEEREQIKQQPTEKSGGAVFNIRPAGVSPTKGQDMAAASKETIGSTVSDMGAGATKLAAAERAENVRGGKNPMFKQTAPQGWEDAAAVQRQDERNLYRTRLDLELAKVREDAALKAYELSGMGMESQDNYGIWQKAKHDRAAAETAYHREAGIPDSLLERIAYTMKGGAKQSVGSNADAIGFAYQIGQNSRDEMNSSVISTAKRAYEDHLRELNDMIAAGKPREAVERQRQVMEYYKEQYETLAGISDVQRGTGEAARDLAAEISQSGAVDVDTAKRGLGTFGGMLVDAGASLTQSAIDRGVGKLLGVVPGKKEQNVIHQMQQSGALNKLDVTGIKLGQMLPFGSRAFGGGTMEARADGADLQQQMLYGAGMSAIETASEFLSDIVQPFAAVMGSGVTDDVVERAVRNVTNRLAKSETGRQVLGRLLTYGAGGIGEGIEEAIADWAEWQLPRIYGGEVDSAAEVLENSLYDFAVGTLSGLGDPRVLLNRFDSGEPSAERGNRQNGPVFDGMQAKEDAGQDLSGGVRYSLKKFDDGTAFVDVDIDQERFAGLTTEQMQNEAKKAILERFRNKVIGTDYKAFVNKRAAEHYAYPVNRRMDEIQKQDKMQASTELDNIISASVFRENVPDDGRHPAATGGIDKLDTKFRVNGRLYEAEISVLVTERGRLFYDLTKFKDITREIGLTTHKGDAAEADGDVSINSIPQTGQKSKGILSGEERGAESTAVNTNPAIHTPEEQAVIDEYQAAVDDSILSFINKWEKLQNPDYKRKIRMQIGEVTERAVQDVRRLTGIDVTGFEHSISGGALEHIENRHGKDGKADRSMTDRNDLARIGYVLAHYDNVELLNRTSNEHRGADGKQAELIQFRKKVNGTYYVVEAVPDSKAKQMRVVSAYMAKENGIADQVLNMPQSGPQLTPKAPVDAHDSVSSHSIPQTTQKSKGILSGEERGTESAGQQKTAPKVGAGDVSLVQRLQQSVPDLQGMKPVAEVTGQELPQGEKIVDRLVGFVNRIGNKVNRPGFGDVLFSRGRIKSSMLGHGIGKAKTEIFAAVPAVIQSGKQIDFQENWKGRSYDTYTFAAPVTYHGQQTYLGVIVTKDSSSSRYYVHEVVDGDGNVIFQNNETQELPSDGTSALSGDLDTVANPASINSIPQTGQKSKRVLSEEERGTESTAVNTNPAIHTPEEQAVIDEYQAAVDERLVNFIEESVKNKGSNKGRFELQPVSDRAAGDIKEITGIDVSGYRTVLEQRMAEHIVDRHGSEGAADMSMQDVNDIARMQYVLDNYDSIEDAGQTNAYMTNKPNGKQGQARTVQYIKAVNGTYYVVEAVPDTKTKTAYIVSAYMTKNKKTGTLHSADAKAPAYTAKTGSASIPVTDSIPQTTQKSKGILSGEERGTESAGQQKTAPEAGAGDVVQKGVVPFSEQEAQNLTSHKGVVNGYGATFRQFIDNVKQLGNTVRYYFGKVSEDLGTAIHNATGFDVSGYNIVIRSDEVTHTLSQHGDSAKEALRGQLPVTADVLERLPEIFSEPDEIIPLKDKDYAGRDAFEIRKQIDGYMVAVVGVANGKNSIEVDTVYIIDKKGKSPATSNTGQMTDLSHTSETSSGPTSTDSIPQATQKSKRVLSGAELGAFGPQGQQIANMAVFTAMEHGQSKQEAFAAVMQAYERGLTGQEKTAIDGLPRGAMEFAYGAGKRDAAASLAREKQAARFAPVAGNEAGLVLDDYVEETMESGEYDVLNETAKRLGVRVRFVDELKHGANADIHGSEILIQKDNPNPVRFLLGHEFAHRLQALAPEAYRQFRDLAMGQLGSEMTLERRESYGEQGVDVDYEGAMDELTADYAGLLMEHGNVLEDFIAEAQRRDNRTLLEKVRDVIRALAEKLTGKQREQALTAEQALSKALMEAEKQAKKNAGKNKTAARSDGETRYSLRVFDDGKRFVDVEAEQAQFDGLTEKQMGYQARQVIKQKFKGKVIGLENRAFVNGKTAEEYSYVKPGTSPKIREAKMRASTELDNLLDAGTNFRTEPDGRDGHIHPEATGDFRYFDTIFKVAGEYYSGIINIEPVARGLLLKDITQIENITQEIRASYGENPQGRYLRDVSMDSIPDSDGKSKGKFSMTGALEFADAVLEAQNNREGQMDEQARRELIRLTEEFREKLIEEYGEIKHGENPAREVHLPRKTGEREKVSQTVRTVLEAQATPETAVPDIERLTMEGVFSHEVYGDEQAVRDAEEIIRDKGMERAYADWRNDIRNGVVSKEHTALGWTLYNNAANEGNTQLALDILQNMVDHQRSAAQALQATRILKTLSPETQLYHVQRSVRNLQEELKKRYKDKAPTLQLNEELAADFLQAETEEARDAAQAALYRDIGRQMPSKFIDKWNAWRYLAMLGNARTHVRNVVGNAGFAPVVAVKNTIATGLETVTDKVSGGKAFSGERGARTKALTAGKALYQAAFDDYGRVKAQVMAGGKYQDFAPNSAIEEGRVIFKSKLMKPVEWARRKNGAALELEDSWFAKPHYAAALASYCKANGITAEQVRSGKGLDKAREYAIREAQKATYRDTNDFSQWVSSIGRYSGDNKAARAASVLVKGILPFRKTPANILARGVEYSPAGLLWNVGRSIYRGYKGTLNTAEFLDGISAGLTGTGLLALGFWLAAEGLVRGAGAGDDAEQEFAELMGHQDYALELPDGTSVTLDWLAPEALPFFVGVNLYEEASRKNGGARLNMADWLAVLGNVSEPMLEMSCLQSLNDLFDFVSYGKKEGSALGSVVFGAITSYLMQALPTIFGQAERSGEDKGMMTYPEANNWLTRDVQYALGKASARVPGLDFLQIPYIDAWGREELTGKPASRVVNNFLNPAYMSKIDESAMEQELMRLYDVTGDKAVFPSRAGKSFTVDKVDKKLTGEEYVKYATAQGQTAYSIVCRLIESKAYEGMDDETKAACVELAYEYAEAYARTQVSAYMPTDWRRKAFTTISSTGVKPEDYICAYQAQKGVGVLKDADEKTIPNSESLLKMEAVYSVSGLTDAQRKAMFADFEVGKSVQGLNRAAVEAQLNRWR